MSKQDRAGSGGEIRLQRLLTGPRTPLDRTVTRQNRPDDGPRDARPPGNDPPADDGSSGPSRGQTQRPGRAPWTLLDAVVIARRWTSEECLQRFAAAAQELGEPATLSLAQLKRWRRGGLNGLPRPTACRVAEHLFGYPIEDLFGPPAAVTTSPTTCRSRADERPAMTCSLRAADSHRTPGRHRGPESSHRPVVRQATVEEEIDMAASEAARFAQAIEQTNIGPHSVEQFFSDIRRIAAVYPNRPVYPTFVEIRQLALRAFEKLEGRQFPDQSLDLYLIAGVLCGLQSNACFDLGHLEAARTQARTGYLCAELAGSNWLRVWLRGMQSLIAYWDDDPLQAIALAEDGLKLVPERGTATVRLAAIQARAYGRVHDAGGVRAALRTADQARDAIRQKDDPGGMMSFPQAKQHLYAATAGLWLGDSAAVRQARRDAELAVEQYEQDPPEYRRLGELNLARLDLATARVALGDLEGMTEQVRLVLGVAGRRPTDSVARRLRQVAEALGRPRFAGQQVVQSLREEIAAYTRRTAIPAISAELT